MGLNKKDHTMNLHILKQYAKIPFLKLFSLIGLWFRGYFDKELKKEEIHKILIFCLGGIGDNIRLFPIIRALHEAFPLASFTILIDSANEGFFKLFPGSFFNFIYFNLYKEHKRLLVKILFSISLRRYRFDLIYNPHRGVGMIEGTIMSGVIGAPYRIGFTENGSGFLYTTKIEFKRESPILRQNIALLKEAGIAINNPNIEIVIPKEDILFARGFLKRHNISEDDLIFCVHPGAYWASKLRCWPLDNFIDLFLQIDLRYKAKIIIIGNRDEVHINNYISERIKSPNIISSIRDTSIGRMSTLIKSSHLFIGNDSGPLHIALALNIPSIGIFGSTSPKQVISNNSTTFIAIKKDLPCSPCFVHQALFIPRCDDVRCLNTISVSEVMDAIDKVLGKHSAFSG
ncbi:MAG: glycosyltransferase family 9 protein [Nitrospinae bacterium]|nr:glycosyltransferase family 9 protein [Nitrospinota bacterium]